MRQVTDTVPPDEEHNKLEPRSGRRSEQPRVSRQPARDRRRAAAGTVDLTGFVGEDAWMVGKYET